MPIQPGRICSEQYEALDEPCADAIRKAKRAENTQRKIEHYKQKMEPDPTSKDLKSLKRLSDAASLVPKMFGDKKDICELIFNMISQVLDLIASELDERKISQDLGK